MVEDAFSILVEKVQSEVVNPTPLVLGLFLVGLGTVGLAIEACINQQVLHVF